MKFSIYNKSNILISSISLLITFVSPIFSNLTFQDAQYSTIYYETNGGTPISSRTFKVGDSIDIPTTTREGFTFVDWYTDISMVKEFNLTIMPAWDIKIYAKWDANLYTISFETNRGNTIPSIQGYFGDPITPPSNPTREGYTFNTWYVDTNFTQSASIPTTMPAQNLTLYAQWAINQYTITFETNGGNSIQMQTKNYNSSLVLPTPAKVGHSFGGWFTDVRLTQPFNLTNMPASDVTLYAKWTINQYTITFNTNGGSSLASITGNYGDSVTAPSNPTREGYTFNGWFANASLTQSTSIPTTIPSQNQTLYAKWTINQYTITFNTNGGTSIQTQTNNYNVNLSIPTPTRVGHSFAGWFRDVGLTQAFTLTTMPAQNQTLYAKWTINQYTITFETNGGSSLSPITGNYNDPVTAPSNPTRFGYVFDGWYSDINLTDRVMVPSNIPDSNLILYARWLLSKITAFDGSAGDYFSEVAIHGNHFVVGSCNDDDKGVDSGSIYIYNLNNFNDVRKITAFDGSANDWFGCNVSIYGDYVVASSFGDDDLGNDSGSVYIYKISNISYVRKINAYDGKSSDEFGSDIIAYGDYLAVGSPDSNEYKGAIYIYKFSDSSYVRKITPSTGVSGVGGDFFGAYNSIALYGNYLLAGVRYNNNIYGYRAGSVYIYKLDDTNYESKIIAFDGFGATSPFSLGDLFGSSVSIYGDYFIVGASNAKNNGVNSGSVYIYKFSDPAYVRKITPLDNQIRSFGSKVSIYGDFIIISSYNSSNSSGRVFIYNLNNLGIEYLMESNDEAQMNHFGTDTAIYQEIILVSATNDDQLLSNKGVVYVYKLDDLVN